MKTLNEIKVQDEHLDFINGINKYLRKGQFENERLEAVIKLQTKSIKKLEAELASLRSEGCEGCRYENYRGNGSPCKICKRKVKDMFSPPQTDQTEGE